MIHQLHVPDMSCDHCRLRIETALRKIPAVKRVVVKLSDKTVTVEAEADLKKAEILKTIAELGYHPA